MNLRNIACYACFFLALPSIAFSQEDMQSRYWQELLRADTDFSQAATERGRSQGFLEVLGEGSVVFRQGPVDARKLYQENQALWDLNQLSWRAHFIDVSRDGDLGFTVGPNVFTAIEEDQDQEARREAYSHLVNVWRKVEGEWKLFADMVVRVPGFLSLDVEPDFREFILVTTETAPPEMAAGNDLQGLIDADNRFGLSINARGGQRALLRYGLQHQRVYLPGMAPAVGAEAAIAAYGKFLDNRVATTSPMTVTHLGAFLSSSKELGYTYGIMTSNADADMSGFRTNYLRVWRYTTSNEWRISMEFLSDY